MTRTRYTIEPDARTGRYYVCRDGQRIFPGYAKETGALRAIRRMELDDLTSQAANAEQLKERTRQLIGQLITFGELLHAANTPIILPAETLPLLAALDPHAARLIADHPGMLFWVRSCPAAGLTLDKTRLVLVPNAIYQPYERACLHEAGWSREQEDAYYESISQEIYDEEVGIETLVTPDWPNPVARVGIWKARQVSHWTGEEATTLGVSYPVWPNGTWG